VTVEQLAAAAGSSPAAKTRANPHWRQIGSSTQTLLVVPGPQAYVSPSWYASKAEHGKVVPTWNYSAVHLTGRAQVHEDVEWLRRTVGDLVARHEESRPAPWSSADAPERYIRGGGLTLRDGLVGWPTAGGGCRRR
jgi:transcriptional regulator